MYVCVELIRQLQSLDNLRVSLSHTRLPHVRMKDKTVYKGNALEFFWVSAHQLLRPGSVLFFVVGGVFVRIEAFNVWWIGDYPTSMINQIVYKPRSAFDPRELWWSMQFQFIFIFIRSELWADVLLWTMNSLKIVIVMQRSWRRFFCFLRILDV